MNIQEINISEINPDPDQPRKTFDADAMERLTQSIQDNGIEQPIIIRKNGAGYIIIDGERRWRAAKENGLKTIPSIVSDKDNVLEQQLRSDCLKEGLTPDELDKAIYRYYEQLRTSTQLTRKDDEGYRKVAKSIGKSDARVRIAIDRFEFKDANPDIEKKFKKTEGGHDIFNSTIPMTSGIKDNDTRREVLETALEYKSDGSIQNEDVKEAVKEIKENNITGKKNIERVFKHKAILRFNKLNESRDEAEEKRKEKALSQKEKTMLEMSLEEQRYLSCLERIISILPQNPPREITTKEFIKSATGYAKVIIKRLEAING